jgi:hypothetical protein
MHRDRSPFIVDPHCLDGLHKVVVAVQRHFQTLEVIILSQLLDILNVAYHVSGSGFLQFKEEITVKPIARIEPLRFF